MNEKELLHAVNDAKKTCEVGMIERKAGNFKFIDTGRNLLTMFGKIRDAIIELHLDLAIEVDNHSNKNPRDILDANTLAFLKDLETFLTSERPDSTSS